MDDVKKIYFGESGGTIIVEIRLDAFQPFRNIDDTLDIDLVFTANEGKWKTALRAHTNAQISWYS